MKYSVDDYEDKKLTEQEALSDCAEDFMNSVRYRVLEKFEAGYSGWSNPIFPTNDIKLFIKNELQKEELDPIDIAAFAMFLWNRQD